MRWLGGPSRNQKNRPPGDLFGHPRGLAVLFAAEAWERFSYFGNAALLVLYLVKYLLEPARAENVLGLSALRAAFETVLGPLAPQPFASQLYGFYTGIAYCMPVVGGLLADRVLGQRRTAVIGGLLMAAGHFLMAVEALLLPALTLLMLGIGAFKPNISTQVGALYGPADQRRDRAFSIFYVGINIGAFVAPLVCGTLAAVYGWHAGFTAAGVGMLVSLAIYLGNTNALPPDTRPQRHAASAAPLTRDERHNLFAILGICALVTLFWAASDQQGNTVVLWAEDFTDRTIASWQLPATFILALNPLMIFLLTPFIVRLWAWQGRMGREPAAASKMAFGCLLLALGNLVLAAAAAGGGKASAGWLIPYFALSTLGELHLAPVGLALVSKLTPPRLLSLTMGVWFAATLPADILGGYLGGFWSTMEKRDFFLMIAAIPALGGAAIWIFQRAVIRPAANHSGRAEEGSSS
jgi:proton-dependent oligopeptide transporter, POT family